MEPLRVSSSPQNLIEMRARAFGIIREKSFFRRRITLASGRESDFYFDMKPTMFDPDGAMMLARLLLARLADVPVDYAGGLALGAIPLTAFVTAVSSGTARPVAGFFVRKEIKGHGTRRLVEGLAEGATLSGKDVAILEDVTTTGGSAMVAVNAAREAGARIAMVLSVVDREEGAAEFYRNEGIAFGSLFTAGEFLAS